jgi:hypothetical protein
VARAREGPVRGGRDRYRARPELPPRLFGAVGQLDPPTILGLDLSALGYDRFATGRLLREDNVI